MLHAHELALRSGKVLDLPTHQFLKRMGDQAHREESLSFPCRYKIVEPLSQSSGGHHLSEAISRLVSQPDVLREFVYISPGTESTTGTGKNNRSNMFLLFNSLQCVNNRINEFVVQSIQFGRTFKCENRN